MVNGGDFDFFGGGLGRNCIGILEHSDWTVDCLFVIYMGVIQSTSVVLLMCEAASNPLNMDRETLVLRVPNLLPLDGPMRELPGACTI